MSVFGTNLNEIMKERNISPKQLIEMANVDKNVVYEINKHEPMLANAVKITDALNVSLDYLVGKEVAEDFFVNPNYKISFYENLDKELKNQGISKRKFCRDLEYSLASFTRWKNGDLPYFQKIIEISTYLNCSIDTLIGRTSK